MRLKSLTLNGFKSFPDRTRLDFGPGVSVVVGPNGSGKSNVTDAVLWAMGEQSPLAVRGQSMQDVIFGGGRGVQPRSAAEVEIVLDNSDGTVDLPLSEISIVRRLDRNGEGDYRLNGARCRLTDVIEVLSDTGLGKETHSVISQGRVDAIVTSKPRDRRLLIEEAAGLGKHRKRRRRAQLKLERTQENLDRALDVEREARSRLRPLKRQAEAAELHERLERQILQARWELAREDCRARRVELERAEARVGRRARGARGDRAPAAGRRSPAGASPSARWPSAPSATTRSPGCSTTPARRTSASRCAASRSAPAHRRSPAGSSASSWSCRGSHARASTPTRKARTARHPRRRSARAASRRWRRSWRRSRPAASRRSSARSPSCRASTSASSRSSSGRRRRLRTHGRAREGADAQAERARERLTAAEQRRAGHAPRVRARRRRARRREPVPARPRGRRRRAMRTRPKALSEELRVQDGYELALAAALGGRLDAALVKDVSGAESLLDRAGPDGGTALLANLEAAGSPPGRECFGTRSQRAGGRRPQAAGPAQRASGGARAGRAAARGRVGGRAPGGASDGLHRHRRHASGARVVRLVGGGAPAGRGRQRARAGPPQRTRPADRCQPSGRRRPSTPRAAPASRRWRSCAPPTRRA